MSQKDHFQDEDRQLAALVRDLENTDSLESNVVAFLSSKIQIIRKSLKEKNKRLQVVPPTQKRTNRNLEKPSTVSLADLKKKEYFSF
jgi:Mor family transcriptional regulator